MNFLCICVGVNFYVYMWVLVSVCALMCVCKSRNVLLHAKKVRTQPGCADFTQEAETEHLI